ncbi:hypothetical protein ACWGCC_03900 [Streptomyces nigrescens]
MQHQIEAAYQLPLAELHERSTASGTPSLLGAALSIHEQLRFADHSVSFQLESLRKFVDPERDIGDFDVSHIQGCVQRLAQAHSARTAHAAAITALLAARTASTSAATPHVPAASPTTTRSR